MALRKASRGGCQTGQCGGGDCQGREGGQTDLPAGDSHGQQAAGSGGPHLSAPGSGHVLQEAGQVPDRDLHQDSRPGPETGDVGGGW